MISIINQNVLFLYMYTASNFHIHAIISLFYWAKNDDHKNNILLICWRTHMHLSMGICMSVYPGCAWNIFIFILFKTIKVKYLYRTSWFWLWLRINITLYAKCHLAWCVSKKWLIQKVMKYSSGEGASSNDIDLRDFYSILLLMVMGVMSL